MKKYIFFLNLIFLSAIFIFSSCAINFYPNDLYSETVYVINENSGMVIIDKNASIRRSPASLTKIMTFIVAYENAKNLENTKVKVSKNILDLVDPESSGVELFDGEEISILDLMHCILISSSGYAAMVLADYIGGGKITRFVEMMNEKCEELGCKDTHFENPDGIYSENQYSTAIDIYNITKCAMAIPLFSNIVSKSEYSCFGDERDPMITTNKMIDVKRGGEYYHPNVRGIKTGSIKKAGRCLVSRAQKQNEIYTAVVMGAPMQDDNGNEIEKNLAMIDTKNIYNWVFENLDIFKLYSRNLPVQEVDLEFVSKRDKLLLFSENDFYAALPFGFSQDDITTKTNVPQIIDAPVKAGDILGETEVFYKGEKIGSINLISTENFKRNYFLFLVRIIKNLITSPIFIIFIIFALLYLAMLVRMNHIRKRKNKIKKFSNAKNIRK